MQSSVERAPARHVLVAIPAYNEEATIGGVVDRVRRAAPDFDLLVVNDGSQDGTEAILRRLGVTTATHLCNLGYGRAVQTAIKYAQRHGYDALITFDADGQHRPEDLTRVYETFASGSDDVVIGSRFIERKRYDSEPLARRIGMRLFSSLIGLVTGKRIFDTSSGLKVVGRRVFDVMGRRPFIDFHAEAIVYLVESGFGVGECPISVNQRTHGMSMYTAASALKYPIKVCFLLFLGLLDARLTRAARA
jgi:hypothetical protein